MNVIKSLEHFEWKLKNQWKPTKADIEHYNDLVNYIKAKERGQIKENQLLGKLYIYLYGEFTKYYECNIGDGTPQKEINKILNKPARDVLINVVDAMNEQAKINAKNPLKTSCVTFEEASFNFETMINSSINTYK